MIYVKIILGWLLYNINFTTTKGNPIFVGVPISLVDFG